MALPVVGDVKVVREVLPGVERHLPDLLHQVLATSQLGQVAARVVETLKQHLGRLSLEMILL